MRLSRIAAAFCAALMFALATTPVHAGNGNDGRGAALIVGLLLGMAAIQQAAQAQNAPVYAQQGYVNPYAPVQQQVPPYLPQLYAQPPRQAPVYQTVPVQAPAFAARHHRCRDVGVAPDGSTLFACR